MPDDPEVRPEDDFEVRMRELEEKAAKIKASVQIPEPKHIGEGFDEKIGEIEQRARIAKATHDSVRSEEERRLLQGGSDQRGLGLGYSIAYTIIGVPLIGAAIGYLLDNQLHTVYWKGYLTLAGAVVGLVLAVVTLNRSNPKS
jgi:F0F1-type ATP synthase assembly protein I